MLKSIKNADLPKNNYFNKKLADSDVLIARNVKYSHSMPNSSKSDVFTFPRPIVEKVKVAEKFGIHLFCYPRNLTGVVFV